MAGSSRVLMGESDMNETKKKMWTLVEAKKLADMAILDVKNGFVEVGYYLKYIRDNALWESGYRSFNDFLEMNYEREKSWASRCIGLYDNFGAQVEDGELPRLAAQYAEYNVSQLIEMISMSAEQRETVNPNMSVRAIRALKPKRGPRVATVATAGEEEQEPEAAAETASGGTWERDAAEQDSGEQFPWAQEKKPGKCLYRAEYKCSLKKEYQKCVGDGSDCSRKCCWFCEMHGACNMECASSEQRPKPETTEESDCGCLIYDHNVKCPTYEVDDCVEVCCEDCMKDCGHRCPVAKVPEGFGREQDAAEEQEEAEQGDPEDLEEQEDVANTDLVDDAKGVPTVSYTRADISSEIISLRKNIEVFEKDELIKEQIIYRKTHMRHDALVMLKEWFEKTEGRQAKQPYLPTLRNHDQRAEFLDEYEYWPLWIETVETGERYYRYDLPDGTSMVVKVYHTMLYDHSKTDLPWEERYTAGYGDAEYYLLKPGKLFRECETNRSSLIDKLKEIQKKG